MNLTIPVTISLLIAICGLRNEDPCFYEGILPDYLFFESPPAYYLDEFIIKKVGGFFFFFWVFLLGYFFFFV